MMLKLTLVRFIYWLKRRFNDPVALFETLGVERDDEILEIGCAIGYHTIPLAKLATKGTIYAVDVWDEGITYLNRKAKSLANIETICKKAEDLDCSRSSLDKIVCFDTFHEIDAPKKAIEKWITFLREGGRLYYRDPEIPPETISDLSNGKLKHVKTTEDVHSFVRA